jgi:hypothetical protein
LAEHLLTRPAFASHETEAGWVRLHLKRLAPSTDDAVAVTCAIRKPGGELLVGVPRLVGPADPPTILGTFARRGSWLHYEAIFPDFFVEADADTELPAGRYFVHWATVPPPGGRPHILASDSFDWPTADN